MKVLLTGGSGFVGRWLARELEATGHIPLPTGGRTDLDVRDSRAVHRRLAETEPDAVVHLAAVSFAPDAAADPATALAVNVGGTLNVLEAARGLARPPIVLVAGSSEVYGAPAPDALPIKEDAPVAPRTPYAMSKAAQEAVALAYAARYGLSVVVTRAFNHSGPGQRPVFVVPGLAARVLALREGRASAVPVGNLDVRRDFTDVRDVVRAYRLLLEAARDGPAKPGSVFNVASGEGVTIREILALLCDLAQVEDRIVVDPTLVRPNDPPDIRGDATALEAATGWRPERGVSEMVAAVWDDASRTTSASASRA